MKFLTKLFPSALLVNPTKFLGEINVPQEVLLGHTALYSTPDGFCRLVSSFRLFSLFGNCLHI